MVDHDYPQMKQATTEPPSAKGINYLKFLINMSSSVQNETNQTKCIFHKSWKSLLASIKLPSDHHVEVDSFRSPASPIITIGSSAPWHLDKYLQSSVSANGAKYSVKGGHAGASATSTPWMGNRVHQQSWTQVWKPFLCSRSTTTQH